jgi:hypothetical protein
MAGRARQAFAAHRLMLSLNSVATNAYCFLSDVDPYDARLHIYLPSSTGETLEVIEGGGVFQSGVFKLCALQPAAIQFEFFSNDMRYQVSVAASDSRHKNKLQRHRLAITALNHLNREDR